MDLLQEARKGNKEAFKELTEDLEVKLYKTARYYFTVEEDVVSVMKITMKKLFKEIVNVKTEEQLIPLAMKFLIKNCEEIYLKKSKNKNWLSYVDNNANKDKYKKYRDSSIEEEYITSLSKELRLIAILYYYDGLTSRQIANILKKSAKDVEEVVDAARDRLYEMISNEGVKKYNEYVK